MQLFALAELPAFTKKAKSVITNRVLLITIL